MSVTRLTLHWHLREVASGTTCIGGESHEYDQYLDNESSKVLAENALDHDDSVVYLDELAHEPTVPTELRKDAEQLLTTHILERRLDITPSTPSNENYPPPKEIVYWWGARCPNCLEGAATYDWRTETAKCKDCGNTLGDVPEHNQELD